MNCRDFLIEFEDRNALTEAATLHLNDCLNCQKTSAEQTQVWQMIGGLRRVDAPKDFDFHLKARIAKASANDFNPRYLPVLRYVLPLSVIVLIFTLIVFNTVFLNDTNGVPQVSETSFPAAVEQENTFAQTSNGQFEIANNYQNPSIENPAVPISNTDKQSQDVAIPKKETEFAAVRQTKKKLNGVSQKSIKDNFTGSRDSSLTNSTEKLPEGLNPKKKIEVVPNVSGVKIFTAAEILLELGIETVLENGKRVVKSVRQKSVGETSSIKNGDIVEAINGKKLTDEPTPGEKIEGKALTVTRGGAKMEILLRNQLN
ncbi:MAG: hypothetical protein WKF90_14320 [Pyrinomonadaceae bacterium]